LSTLSESELHYFPEFISDVRSYGYSISYYFKYYPYSPGNSDLYDYCGEKHKPLDERKAVYMGAMKETAEKSLKTGIV
jgi:hypothetical protein